MYGDHFPSLSITDDELTNGNVYQTEYIIWNNMGLELEDKDIETYQLYSRVLQALNIDGGFINKYHQVYQNDEYYLEQLKTLTYDMLYGDMYVFDGINPYISTDLMLGTYPITIKKVIKEEISEDTPITEEETTTVEGEESDEKDDDEKDDEISDKITYLVKGSHFTLYSHVSVNGDQVETEFVDDETLRIFLDEPMESFSSIVVNQKWKASIVSKTSEYIYITVEIPTEDDITNETETTELSDEETTSAE